MFSEAYKKLCIENAEKLREEWEKRGWQEGDWFYNPSQDKVHLLTRYNTWFIGAPKRFAEHNVPLPTPRQLIRMLEERGCEGLSLHRSYIDQIAFGSEPEWAVRYEGGPYPETVFGPDPETALLKALMEVMKDDIPSNSSTSP